MRIEDVRRVPLGTVTRSAEETGIGRGGDGDGDGDGDDEGWTA